MVEAKWSTEEFPGWDLLPASPWNYGLAVDKNRIRSQVPVELGSVSSDPWAESPIRLSVPMRRIPGWEATTGSGDGGRKRFTPPLPKLSSDSIAAQRETVTLVPFGSTHLRITVFPDAGL